MEKLTGRLAIQLAAIIVTASLGLPQAWAGGETRTVSVPALGVRVKGFRRRQLHRHPVRADHER